MSPLISTTGNATARGFGWAISSLGSSSYWLATWGTSSTSAGMQCAATNNRVLVPTQNNSIYSLMAINNTGSPVTTTQPTTSGNLFNCAGYDGASIYFPLQNGEFVRNTNGTIDFQKKLNGASDNAYACVPDSSGNIYTLGTFTTNTRKILTKWNSAGTQQWSNYFSSVTGMSLTSGSIKIDASSNVIAAWDAVGAYQYANLTVQNSSGVMQWSKSNTNGSTDAGNYTLAGNSVGVDSSGNVYVVLSTLKQSSGGTPTANIIKYNSSGTVQWNRQLTGANSIKSMDTDQNGNTYVLCQRSGTTNFTVVKYDTSGTVVWQRNFASSANYMTVAGSINGGVSADNAGAIYLSGVLGSGVGAVKPFCFRYPEDGSKTGTYTLDGRSITIATTGTLTDAAGSYTFPAGSITVTSITQSAAGTSTTSTVSNTITKTTI